MYLALEVRKVHNKDIFFLAPDDMKMKTVHACITKALSGAVKDGQRILFENINLQQIIKSLFHGDYVRVGYLDVYKDREYAAKLFIRKIANGGPVALSV